ncbi:MAG: hypothetical protein ACOX24_07820 [Christensenellales bacterium]|jgi:hypothetical protein|nr:hypothetical protein [Clostridiales bacterium]
MKKTMKKTLLVLVLVASVLALSFNLLACDKPEAPEEKAAFAIPESLNINIELSNGYESLGTITKDVLKDVEQRQVTMTTTNDFDTTTSRVYVAYKLTDILDELDIDVTVDNVNSIASDNKAISAANITNAYITIGEVQDGAFVEDDSAPRYISDSTSTSSKTVNKKLDKVVFNYAYNLSVHMTQGDKTNDIVVPFTDFAEVERITHDYVKDGVTTKYDGFNLKDILISMGKFTKTGEPFPFITDYTSVGFVCSDDKAGEDHSARVFTKAEIESAESYIRIVKDGNTARSFSDLGEPTEGAKTYRHRLKKITKIIVNGEDAATLEISWVAA